MTVSDKVMVATINDIGDFTLASTIAAETNYPLTNVQNENPNQPAVFDMVTTPASFTISATQATAYSANCLAITGINLPADNEIQLLLYPDAAYGGTAYDSGDLAVIRLGSNSKGQFILCFDSFSYKSFKIVITTPSYTNTEIVIDKIWLGTGYVFEHGMEYGSRFWMEDTSRHQVKPGGGVETYPGDASRRMNLIFKGSSDTEIKLVQDALELAQMTGDLFCSADPNDSRGFRHKRSGIFVRENQIDFVSKHLNWHNHQLTLREN